MAAAVERSRPRKVLVGLFRRLVVMADLLIDVGTLQVEDVASDAGRAGKPFPAEEDRPTEATDESLTFLVVGVDPPDQATGGTRAEAALLLRLTGDRHHAQVVSIALYTWVAEQTTTIEDAFADAGPMGAVSALATLTDVRVQHYAELDYGGFRSVVNTWGGGTVAVREPYASQGVSFSPGPQQMDGAEAVAYLRDASVAMCAGSSGWQQRMVQTVFDRIERRGALTNFRDLGKLLRSVTDAVRVNEALASEDLMATAWEFRGVGNPELLRVPVGGAGTVAGRAGVAPGRRPCAGVMGALASRRSGRPPGRLPLPAIADATTRPSLWFAPPCTGSPSRHTCSNSAPPSSRAASGGALGFTMAAVAVCVAVLIATPHSPQCVAELPPIPSSATLFEP
jgi:LCP family protein required for cell wall assembly